MAEFVGQERIRVELGPPRLALAVNDGDLAQLTVAMRAASSMWGGRRFPILPVDDDAELVLGAAGLLDIRRIEQEKIPLSVALDAVHAVLGQPTDNGRGLPHPLA